MFELLLWDGLAAEALGLAPASELRTQRDWSPLANKQEDACTGLACPQPRPAQIESFWAGGCCFGGRSNGIAANRLKIGQYCNQSIS